MTWFIMWLFFCWTSSNQFQHKLVKKISYQVHLNQSETEKYFERIYDKDIYEKSYTTHVKTHSSLTLSVVLVSAAQRYLWKELYYSCQNTFKFNSICCACISCPILFSSTGHSIRPFSFFHPQVLVIQISPFLSSLDLPLF